MKRKYWLFEIYLDSCEDFVDIAERIGLPMAFSPLHDKDIKKDGTLKKPHRHVILAFSNTTTFNTALSIAKQFNANTVLPCDSIKGSYDYHVHKNNKDKYHYSDDDRILLNGFNIFDYIPLTDDLEFSYFKNIFQIIVDNNIRSLTSLLSVFIANDDYKSLKLIMSNSYFYSKLIEEQKICCMSSSKRSDTP